MRFLYHIRHGAQLFEDDGTDRREDGWFFHPEEAGLVAIVDPNGPTRWVAPQGSPATASAPVAAPAATEQAIWVQVPEDWESLHWKTLCALASKIKGEEVTTKPEAEAVIRADLARRA